MTMFFLRNKESLRDGSKPRHEVEYRVSADCHFVGEWACEPYRLMLWEFSDKQPGEDRWLCLRTVEIQQEPLSERATKSGYYRGGGIPSEIIALASLFLRRRLRLTGMVRLDGRPMLLSPGASRVHPQLVAGQSNLGTLADWFPLVETLKPELHQRFILAAKLYQEALALIDTKPDLAYLNLVFAVEVVAEEHPIENPSLSDISERIASLVAEIPHAGLKDEIERSLLQRERFIKRRFRTFISEHTEQELWEQDRPQLGRNRACAAAGTS
jgi:hypothetical protein